MYRPLQQSHDHVMGTQSRKNLSYDYRNREVFPEAVEGDQGHRGVQRCGLAAAVPDGEHAGYLQEVDVVP